MKRYNITAEADAYAVGTLEGQRYDSTPRIKIDEADNGEWVRYEDALDCKFNCRRNYPEQIRKLEEKIEIDAITMDNFLKQIKKLEAEIEE